MEKIVNLSLWAFLVVSCVLLFYEYDTEKSIDMLMRSLYFIKDNALIVTLLLYIKRFINKNSRPIWWAAFSFSLAVGLYDTLLINLDLDTYGKFLKNKGVCFLLLLIPLGSYRLSKIFNYKDGGKYRIKRYTGKIFSGIRKKIRRWVRKKK